MAINQIKLNHLEHCLAECLEIALSSFARLDFAFI
jgi:hypothetical protein